MKTFSEYLHFSESYKNTLDFLAESDGENYLKTFNTLEKYKDKVESASTKNIAKVLKAISFASMLPTIKKHGDSMTISQFKTVAQLTKKLPVHWAKASPAEIDGDHADYLAELDDLLQKMEDDISNLE